MITKNEEDAELVINSYNYPENSERNYQIVRHGIDIDFLHHNKENVQKLGLVDILEMNRMKDLKTNIKKILPKWIIEYEVKNEIEIEIKENTMIEEIQVQNKIRLKIDEEEIEINKSCRLNFPIGLLRNKQIIFYGNTVKIIVVYRKLPNHILFKLRKKHVVCMMDGVDCHIVNGKMILCN